MRIFVGYDGSNVSKDALRHAIRRAEASGGEIWLIQSGSGGTGQDVAVIKDAESALEAAKEEVREYGVPCETHLLIRGLEPGEDIVQFAAEHDAEEIILGVKRRSAIGKMLFGSTAQYVILNASCPVTTIR